MTQLPGVQHADSRASVSLLTHQHTEDERLPAVPHGRAAQTASSLLWDPAAGRRKAVWGLRAWHPRLGPALAEGHLVEPSTPWLPPTLDRGHRQLGVTQGRPFSPSAARTPCSLSPAARVAGREAHGVCDWLEALRPFLWHHCPPAPRPAPCWQLLLGVRVLAPSPEHITRCRVSPPTPGQVVPWLFGSLLPRTRGLSISVVSHDGPGS